LKRYLPQQFSEQPTATRQHSPSESSDFPPEVHNLEIDNSQHCPRCLTGARCTYEKPIFAKVPRLPRLSQGPRSSTQLFMSYYPSSNERGRRIIDIISPKHAPSTPPRHGCLRACYRVIKAYLSTAVASSSSSLQFLRKFSTATIAYAPNHGGSLRIV
jgi:hypothetical protein